jgi:protein CWC15
MKRRRILEETREIDADSEAGSQEESSDDDRLDNDIQLLDRKADKASDDEDETAELQRELEKIKRERAEKREQEVRLRSMLQQRALVNIKNAGEGESSRRGGGQGA